MLEILKYEVADILRSKWIYGYGLMLFLISVGLYMIGGSPAKSIVSLLNVVLIVIPLVSMLFGIVYLHSLRPFLEFLLCQPVNRQNVFIGSYLGMSLPLCLSFLLGLGLSFVFYGTDMAQEVTNAFALEISGVLLTLIFTAIAFVVAMGVEDRIKGFAICLLSWLYLVAVHDGVTLLLISLGSDYPVESAAIVLSLLNPVSMARVLILLNLDIAALMGCTGAVFHSFIGSTAGIIVALASLVVWTGCPLAAGLVLFQQKDF